MPQTINGFGTWYWGKTKLKKNRGTCSFCGWTGDLKSYDATKYFVVFFVPVIPLGRKRIIEECPRCRRHRVVDLEEWERIRGQCTDELLTAWRADPDDPEAVAQAIAGMVDLDDRQAFLAAAPEMERSLADKPELLSLLAGAYARFDRLVEAESLYRAALSLSDLPETREQLAVVLLRAGRPDEARYFLEHIMTGLLQEKMGYCRLLIEGYQAAGKHRIALELLDELTRLFPEQAAADSTFGKYRRISERNYSNGRPVKPSDPALGTASPKERRLPVLFARFAAPLIITALFLVYAGLSHLTGLSRPVHVVNGLNRAYGVEINGTHYDLPPFGRVVIDVPEGTVRVKAVEAEMAIPEQTWRISTPFFQRLLTDRTYIINPDQTAIIYSEEILYGESQYADFTDLENRFYAGEGFYSLSNIDYEFVDFPASITTEGTTAKRRRVGQLIEYDPAAAMAIILGESGPEAAAAFAREQLRHDPGAVVYLFYLASLVQPEEMLAFVGPRLADRPVLVDWHRLYQDTIEKSRPDYNLEGEYRTLLAAESEDPALQYLLARTVYDPDEAEVLLKKAAGSDAPCAHACYGLAYSRLSSGDFSAALTYIRQALALAPDRDDFTALEQQILTAVGRYDEVLALLDQEDADAYSGFLLLAEKIRVLTMAGRTEAVQQLLDGLQAEMGEMPDQEGARFWVDYFTAVYCYAAGNIEDYCRLMNKTVNSTWTFEGAVSAGDLDRAAAVLEGMEEATAYQHLVLYLAAAKAGRTEMAEARLAAAAERLRLGSRDERFVAACLTADSPPPAERICRLVLNPGDKKIVLAAMGLKFPGQRGRYFPLARKLNYHRSFPGLLIAEVTRG